MKKAGREFIDGLSGISLSQFYLTEMLDKIVGATVRLMQADACVLFLLDESRQTLLLQASVGLEEGVAEIVRLPRGKGISWRIVTEKKTVSIADAKNDPDFYFVPESGEERFSSMLGVPILDEGECIGVLYTQTFDAREYTEEQIALLEEIATQVAGSVKTAWFLERAKERARILSDLNTFTQIISDTSEIEEILLAVARYTAQLTGSRAQMLWLVDEEGDLQEAYLSEEVDDGERLKSLKNIIVEPVARDKVAIKIDEIESDDRFSALKDFFRRSALCQPMVFGERVVGVICVADRRSYRGDYFYAFSGEEAQSLLSIAQIAAHAVVRAKTHKKLETALDENRQNAEELSILFQLSLAMQRALSLDELLKVILSCVTVGEGLGFNRAAIFLIDEAANKIYGELGMGPNSEEDAGKIWSELGASFQMPTDLVKWLLDRDLSELTDSQFNRKITAFTSTMKVDSVMARAVKEKKAINVIGGANLTEGDTDLVAALSNDHFAVAPLIAHDNVVGIILVDNYFNQSPITEKNIELLSRFATPAAGAIGNIMLFERLSSANSQLLTLKKQMAQAERLSTLGEIYAELAHEIRNPLVTIGGFARRLLSGVKNKEDIGRYASIIVAEVERLEKLLTDTLSISREGVGPNMQEINLGAIVDQSIDLYWKLIKEENIELAIEKDPDLPKVDGDEAQIKQVVINLLLNSIEALSCKTDQDTKTLFVSIGATNEKTPSVRLVIGDNGGGIAPKDLKQIFEPFYTTKSGGTGLGLSLCKRIIRSHHGVMEIDNKPGVGVSFTITLPVRRETSGAQAGIVEK